MKGFSLYPNFAFNRLIKESEHQKQRRQNLKDDVEYVCSSNRGAANVLKSFNGKMQERQRIEAEQAELVSIIVKLVQNSTASDKRRRTECLCSVTSLDDLHRELTELGFHLSRGALYRRLFPCRGNTSEGKRHVNTVPVKLLRPKNSLKKKNEDCMFAKPFINDMFDVCKLFVPDAVLFMSNDDKARISLGLAAVNLQALILMHMEYKVNLIDHDFVVGVNAAGLSEFNPVECRMVPLSHDLAGLVLPYDHYGNHLDSNGKTIDNELEKMNLYKAAEVLSEVWSQTVIDGYPVESNAVPIGKEYIPPNQDPVCVSNHSLQYCYCLQIVKCRDIRCCSPFETNWLTVFNNRFIPFPAIYKYAKHGTDAVEPSVYFESPNNRRCRKLNF